MFYFIKSFLIAVQHEEEIELAPSSDRERNESCEQVSMSSNSFFSSSPTTSGQRFKPFYGRNLRMGIINSVTRLGKILSLGLH
jgi:hypothetical protein